MIFVILIIIGFIGIVGTLWLSSAKARTTEGSITGPAWYSLSPGQIESAASAAVQSRFRELLRILLHWMIGQYRNVSKKITVKQEVKKRVRAFLYEHREGGARNPSAMWGQLQNRSKSDINNVPVISPDEITSSLE